MYFWERFGEVVVQQLCEEISGGGYISTNLQAFILSLMVLCPEDISRIRLGGVPEFVTHRATLFQEFRNVFETMEILRRIKQFFGKTFKLKEDKDGSILASCLGVGFKNYIRQATWAILLLIDLFSYFSVCVWINFKNFWCERNFYCIAWSVIELLK